MTFEVQNRALGMSLKGGLTLLLSATVLIGVVSCASRNWQAGHLYKEGLYAESAEAYENMLKANPSNSEAQSGLLKARAELWKKDLTALREQRGAGNKEGAMSSLEDLLEKRRVWEQGSHPLPSLEPVDQDVRSARQVLEASIREKIAENKPLAASQLWEKFDLLRDEKKYGPFNASLAEEIQYEGKSLCDRMRTYVGSVSFSYGELYAAVCSYYGVQPYDSSLDERQDFRFSKVSVKNQTTLQIAGTTASAQSQAMQQKLDSQLKKIGLISARSKSALAVTWLGSALRKHTSEPQMMAHFYSASGANEGEGSDKRDTVNTETSSASSTEKRTFRYQATAHKESLSANFVLYSKNKSETRVTHTDEEKKEFISHNTNRPEIGLRPLAPAFLPALPWLGVQMEKLAEKFVQALAASIAEKACRGARDIDVSPQSIENFSRCSELNPSDPDAAEWFSNNYGLSRAQIMETVRKSQIQ